MAALPPAAVLSTLAHQLRREADQQAKCQQTPDHLRLATLRLVSKPMHYSPTSPEITSIRFNQPHAQQQQEHAQRAQPGEGVGCQPQPAKLVERKGE